MGVPLIVVLAASGAGALQVPPGPTSEAKTSSVERPWWCPSFADYMPIGESFTSDVPLSEHFGHEFMGWWNTNPGPDFQVLKGLQEQLTEYPIPIPEMVSSHSAWKNSDLPSLMQNGTFSTGKAADIAHAMYSATKVPGIFENVPEALKGVFWMKGNGFPEELVSLQFGTWFPEQQVFVIQMTPFSWSWPIESPFFFPIPGLYKPDFAREKIIKDCAWAWGTLPAYTQALKFDTCPDNLKTCIPGETLARQQFNLLGRTSDDGVANVGDLVPTVAEILGIPQGILPKGLITGTFDLHEMSTDGSKWRRAIKWGLYGCNFLDFGSYDLVKIIDKDGQPLEPYWSEYINYMGDSDSLVWSGFKDEATMNAARDFHMTRQAELLNLSLEVVGFTR